MAKIGNIELGPFPLLLAPMEDVSDPPFRALCKEQGADVMYTEFISSEGLIRAAAKSVMKLDIYEKQKSLQENIYLFRNSLKNLSFISEENSPIQVIEFATRETLTNCIDNMAKLDIYTKPILPPTVPKGSFRMRLCFHSFNSEKEIKLLVSGFL